jgi:hypothetical protein
MSYVEIDSVNVLRGGVLVLERCYLEYLLKRTDFRWHVRDPRYVYRLGASAKKTPALVFLSTQFVWLESLSLAGRPNVYLSH